MRVFQDRDRQARPGRGCLHRPTRTVWVPYLAQELHGRRGQRVVGRELELCREHAALEGRPFWPLYHGLPVQKVVLGDGPGGDSIGRVLGEHAVFLEQAAVGGRRHGGLSRGLCAGAGFVLVEGTQGGLLLALGRRA